MELQVGDRLSDATGEWEAIGPPYTTGPVGRTPAFAFVRVGKPGGHRDPDLTGVNERIAREARDEAHRCTAHCWRFLPRITTSAEPPALRARRLGARFHPRSGVGQDRAPTGAGGPGAPDPPPHARQRLTLGNGTRVGR